MAGHMGNVRRTTQSLLVHRIDTALNLIFVRGAVPGPDDAVVSVRDAIRKVKWKAESAFFSGIPDGQWLSEGVTSLPLPTATVEGVKEARWPSILEWPGKDRAKKAQAV